MRNCAFTICSKNYIAQALTLRDSFLNHNRDCQFYIFLADRPSRDTESMNLELLDDEWIPKWKEMAFKYGVVEFNTSIKPFCINRLFNLGFDKVIYLDPDIYVVDSLDEIYDYLDKYDCVLTPHFCYMHKFFNGAVSETQISSQGLYNLGFGAFKDSTVGHQIVEWWMDRLRTSCYSDTKDGMFVDQKWMDYVPLFFPNNVLVTKHAGINTAIWNLHERELLIRNNKFYIKDCKGNIYPLLFYHFSGFDPDIQKIINRRHPQFNTDVFPSFSPLIEEYRKKLLGNGYEKYRHLLYGFATFENGYKILVLQRRFLRVYINKNHNYNGDPFNPEDEFYHVLNQNNCIYKIYDNHPGTSKETVQRGERIERKYLQPLLKVIKSIIGVGNYYLFVRMLNKIGETEYHYFLLKKK